jgi:hypothetical protein
MSRNNEQDRHEEILANLIELAPSASLEEARLHRKQDLAATFRLFSRYGFDQGLA